MRARSSRRVLLGGTALAAASFGLGWVLRWRATQPPPAAPQPDQASTPAAPIDVFGLRFPTPDGAELVLAGLRGRPLLLNFWATWCAPCLEEMPLLDRFANEHRRAGWQVVGLALDGAAPVREFMARTPVAFPIGLAQGQGVGLSRALGNTRGALPFSVVFDSAGQAVQRKLGAVNSQELSLWASNVR